MATEDVLFLSKAPNDAALAISNAAGSVFRFVTSGSNLLLTRDGTTLQTISTGNSAPADDTPLTFGTDADIAVTLRSTILNANTALTGVIVGTPVTPAVAANSLIVGNITADGDMMFVAQTGGNSQAFLWRDASAGKTYLYGGAGIEALELESGITVVNETGADTDFRVEGDTNANMMVVDAGTDSQSMGSGVVAGAALSISNLTGRTLVTAVGNQVHLPAGSLTDGGVTGTIAELAVVKVGVETVLATNTITYTDVASLVVDLPVASTGATFTRKYAAWFKGAIRCLTNVHVGNNTATFAMTEPTQSVVFQQGTAPAGAITTGGALYTDGTVMKKLIAAGTVSNIET